MLGSYLPEAHLRDGQLRIRGRFCKVNPIRVFAVVHPDYAAGRTMIIAPHADDAELAAFGLFTAAPKPLS